MGKDGLPLVTEEALESPWWLPLLGIFVIVLGLGWVALGLQREAPETVKIQIVAPDTAEAPVAEAPSE